MPATLSCSTDPHPMQALAKEVWALRAGRRITPIVAGELGRRLFAAAIAEMEQLPHYDPPADVRVVWIQQVLLAARLGISHQFGDSNTEAAVEMILGETEDIKTQDTRLEP